MDRERAKELLPIIQAFAEGRAIERRLKNGSQWYVIEYPNWMHEDAEYRIKPEPPKPREWWINDYGNSLAIPVESRESADLCAGPNRIRCIHVREVLDDEEDEERHHLSDSGVDD
jgi:hypothetical protein